MSNNNNETQRNINLLRELLEEVTTSSPVDETGDWLAVDEHVVPDLHQLAAHLSETDTPYLCTMALLKSQQHVKGITYLGRHVVRSCRNVLAREASEG